MTFLFRQRWILALLSALILCGYTADLVECSHASESTTHADEHHAGDPAGEAGCDCICHAGFIYQPLAGFACEAVFAVEAFPRIWGAFPPDAVPRGIDMPPQLG